MGAPRQEACPRLPRTQTHSGPGSWNQFICHSATCAGILNLSLQWHQGMGWQDTVIAMTPRMGWQDTVTVRIVCWWFSTGELDNVYKGNPVSVSTLYMTDAWLKCQIHIHCQVITWLLLRNCQPCGLFYKRACVQCKTVMWLDVAAPCMVQGKAAVVHMNGLRWSIVCGPWSDSSHDLCSPRPPGTAQIMTGVGPWTTNYAALRVGSLILPL